MLGIKGEVVMSQQLEDVLNAFINKKVPKYWEKYAFLSLKPLGSWWDDLILRLKFMKGWVEKEPDSFWVPAFFFP